MLTWKPDDYRLDHLSAKPERVVAEKVFDLVWRCDFTAPGFCLLDLGPGVDSPSLRSWMVDLKDRLSDLCFQRTGTNFFYRSLARFDQQETTKFHLDGAPAESLLILGYEPSKVRSRLSLADYTRCAFSLGMTPQSFLDDCNPMFTKGEKSLSPYITDLPPTQEDISYILVINNSLLPFTEYRKNSLGVLHKAIIVNPTESERRIVNSTMLVTEGEADEIGREQQQQFVTTTNVSQKVYE